MFPLASLMNPYSPHPVPQEFLMSQYYEVYPTARTPWFNPVLQLEKTPDLYDDQFEASTATETGAKVRAFSRAAVVAPTLFIPVSLT